MSELVDAPNGVDKNPTKDEDKRQELKARLAKLRGIFDKVPPESLYDVLVDGLTGKLDGISLNGLETLVPAAEKGAKVFLDNPPPPCLNVSELKDEVRVLLEDLYRLSAEAGGTKEPKWDEWSFDLEQFATSLTTWLKKIWLCVWEYRTSFEKAHECLMAIQGFFETLTTPKFGCICPFSTLPLVVTFEDLSGNVVRVWQNLTSSVLQEVIFWTWRELFMSILIQKRPQYDNLIQGMIRDIEETYGASHHIILLGGSPEGYGIDGYYNDAAMDLEDSDIEEYEDVFDDAIGEFWADHWDGVSCEYDELKDILLTAARKFFVAHPTFHGYLTLCSLEPCRSELHKLLLENAPFSRAATFCALAVFQSRHSLNLMQQILATCSHLFEAHDAPFIRRAAACLLAHSETMEFGLKFMEEQLLDALQCIRIAFHDTFKLDRIPLALESLQEISSLTLKSPERTAKVKAWVKNILVPSASIADPFSLAAMVMGIPVMDDAGDEEEEDEIGERFTESIHVAEFDGLLENLTVNCNRPPLEDLCHINRRNLVKRLNTYLSLVDDLPQGARPKRYKLLTAFERAVFQELPWMRFSDVVSELKAK
ncbi:hypothetical protein M408DRAFT_7136 [Serendipita vermifera MAFF 305830]|uniref:Uncharacterized protein n=1 Tax=Serendipita vermifera MAFF 305830 TaxID=933852 RepID=A0A0C3B3E5_SERVB|nr:hypothetical protein M408DRAFT_7136 [Serendipita vermifera MAFF 305830]